MLVWVHLGVKKKMDQFAIVLHMEANLEYELLKKLFFLLKVKNNPLKHWLDNSVLSKT